MVSPSLNFILKYDMLRKVHSELSQNDCMGETHAKTLTEKQKTHRITPLLDPILTTIPSIFPKGNHILSSKVTD